MHVKVCQANCRAEVLPGVVVSGLDHSSDTKTTSTQCYRPFATVIAAGVWPPYHSIREACRSALSTGPGIPTASDRLVLPQVHMDTSSSAESSGYADADAANDPLLEQMRAALQLSDQLAAAQSRQTRRYSDAALDTANNLWQPGAVTVRSGDGTRDLPLPECEFRISRRRESNKDVANLGSAAAATHVELSQHQCQAKECSVAKVFETTELLEIILSNLETHEILNVRLTNKAWNDAVKQSPGLRIHLFAFPQYNRPAADFLLLPLRLPGLNIELGKPIERGQWIQATLTLDAARKIAPERNARRPVVRSRSIFSGLRGGLQRRPRAGSSKDVWPLTAEPAVKPMGTALQYNDLYITQPPIVGMQAFAVPTKAGTVDQEAGDDDSFATGAKLSCDAGITLGFLAETAQSLLPSASTKSPSGIEASKDERKVAFKAIVSFTDGSPSKKPKNCESTRRVIRFK
jgi:hypothetical protein